MQPLLMTERYIKEHFDKIRKFANVIEERLDESDFCIEAVLEDKTVQTEVQRIEKEINGKGRVLLRKSGTEPVIRIMVECEKEEQCETYVRKLEDCICQGGHCE